MSAKNVKDTRPLTHHSYSVGSPVETNSRLRRGLSRAVHDRQHNGGKANVEQTHVVTGRIAVRAAQRGRGRRGAVKGSATAGQDGKNNVKSIRE